MQVHLYCNSLTLCKCMCVFVVLLCCNVVVGVLSAGGCGADLMHTLWEADVAVFKAHITTGPGGKVLDMFWIYDNRSELPENHRCLPQAQGRQHMGVRSYLVVAKAVSPLKESC